MQLFATRFAGQAEASVLQRTNGLSNEQRSVVLDAWHVSLDVLVTGLLLKVSFWQTCLTKRSVWLQKAYQQPGRRPSDLLHFWEQMHDEEKTQQHTVTRLMLKLQLQWRLSACPSRRVPVWRATPEIDLLG